MCSRGRFVKKSESSELQMDVFFQHPLRRDHLFFLLSFHLRVFKKHFGESHLKNAERNTKICKKIL